MSSVQEDGAQTPNRLGDQNGIEGFQHGLRTIANYVSGPVYAREAFRSHDAQKELFPPSGHVSVSKENPGGRTLLQTLRNIISGQPLAYCVVALVVVALAVLAVILNAILNRVHAKKREVSPSFTAITNPPQHVKGVVGRRERTAQTVP
ncbi:hypothetical protein MRX96_039902 [Rhipicephalus microplus]